MDLSALWELDQHSIAISLFIRLIGFVYFIGFFSILIQVKGLFGSRGILPVRDLLAYTKRLGAKRFYYLPTVFWLNSSDSALVAVCLAGILLGIAVAAGLYVVPALILLWIFYLSFKTVGQDFLNFQWDALLLEVGFASVLLAAAPSPATLLMTWFLLLKFMVMAGLVKIRSKDKSWRELTAMTYHYYTQPLPNPLSWFAHQMPLFIHKLTVVMTFLIEIVVPFLIFGTPEMRLIAFLFLILLQLTISLTGNYGPFNILSAVMCVPLLDDKILQPLSSLALPLSPIIPIPISAIAIFLTILNAAHIIRLYFPKFPGRQILVWLEPFEISNPYGLFAVMTTERSEIIMEWSNDGAEWHEYEFKWKPQRLDQLPPFSAPHMPRLDWLMWFLPFSPYESNFWFSRFMEKLLQNSSDVTGLLKNAPADPPRFVRALIYDYRFTEWKNRKNWWKRTLLGEYAPPTSIRNF